MYAKAGRPRVDCHAPDLHDSIASLQHAAVTRVQKAENWATDLHAAGAGWTQIPPLWQSVKEHTSASQDSHEYEHALLAERASPCRVIPANSLVSQPPAAGLRARQRSMRHNISHIGPCCALGGEAYRHPVQLKAYLPSHCSCRAPPRAKSVHWWPLSSRQLVESAHTHVIAAENPAPTPCWFVTI